MKSKVDTNRMTPAELRADWQKRTGIPISYVPAYSSEPGKGAKPVAGAVITEARGREPMRKLRRRHVKLYRTRKVETEPKRSDLRRAGKLRRLARRIQRLAHAA